jgi:hypothetical protein
MASSAKDDGQAISVHAKSATEAGIIMLPRLGL